MSFGSKAKRARLLYQKRGLKWLVVSAIGELPLAPAIFARIANFIPASPFVALAGVHSNQLWEERRASIFRVTRQFLTGPCDALEIGTWMGQGSTRVWLEILPSGSSLTLIDAWHPYVDQSETTAATAQMDRLHHAAVNSTLREIYRAEAEGRVSVSLIRARSNVALPKIKDASFDLIYIDGSHYYADAKRDIQEAKRLIRPGGLICGDDLDTPATDELLALARENLDLDLVILPDGNAFHPGVLLATSEEFEHVDCENGFWWIEPNSVVDFHEHGAADNIVGFRSPGPPGDLDIDRVGAGL
jgi:predicted O-methyltransferase YrrM